MDPERDGLVRKWRELIDADRSRHELGLKEDEKQVQPGRLMELFRQAGAWQVNNSRRSGQGPWKIASYVPLIIVWSLLLEGRN